MKSNDQKLGASDRVLDVGYRRLELGWDLTVSPLYDQALKVIRLYIGVGDCQKPDVNESWGHVMQS